MSVYLVAHGHVVSLIWQLPSWSKMNSVDPLLFFKCLNVTVLLCHRKHFQSIIRTNAKCNEVEASASSLNTAGLRRKQGCLGRPLSELHWAVLRLSLPIKGGAFTAGSPHSCPQFVLPLPLQWGWVIRKNTLGLLHHLQPDLLWVLSQAKFSHILR